MRPLCSALPGQIVAATPPWCERLDVVLVGLGEQVGGGAADLGRDLRRADALVGARVQPGLQADALAGHQQDAGLVRGEVAVVAVDVDAVGARGRGVAGPEAYGLDVVAAAAEVFGREHVCGEEGRVDARHRRLFFERAEHPDVGQLAVTGEVVAGLRLDRGGARADPLAEPLAHVVAEGPGVGATGHGHRGGHAAARGDDLVVGRAARAHGELGPAVARVDRVGVGVDEAGRDEPAAEVFHVVDVDDVVDDAGDALREVRRGPAQTMRSSCTRIAALLYTSAPVHSRPMFVSKRTVIASPPGLVIARR